jgi:hypothetical protein
VADATVIFALLTQALMLVGLIVGWLVASARWERERMRLVSHIAARTPAEYAVITRADGARKPKPAKADDEPPAPRIPEGL